MMKRSTLGHCSRNCWCCASGAEAHHALDAGAVVPAAVEDHDLAARREVLACSAGCTSEVFSRSDGGGERDDAKHARADALRDRLDEPALAGGIAPLEHDDDALAGMLDPLLQVAELDLQLGELLFVDLALQLLVPGHRTSPCPPSLCRDDPHAFDNDQAVNASLVSRALHARLRARVFPSQVDPPPHLEEARRAVSKDGQQTWCLCPPRDALYGALLRVRLVFVKSTILTLRSLAASAMTARSITAYR